jgi:hypothetical protein
VNDDGATICPLVLILHETGTMMLSGVLDTPQGPLASLGLKPLPVIVTPTDPGPELGVSVIDAVFAVNWN